MNWLKAYIVGFVLSGLLVGYVTAGMKDIQHKTIGGAVMVVVTWPIMMPIVGGMMIYKVAHDTGEKK